MKFRDYVNQSNVIPVLLLWQSSLGRNEGVNPLSRANLAKNPCLNSNSEFERTRQQNSFKTLANMPGSKVILF